MNKKRHGYDPSGDVCVSTRNKTYSSGLVTRCQTGFTLVEMLVVIIIISMLAGMILVGAMSARKRAKIAAIAIEINQLDMALKAYKQKFGEYPPDFAGINSSDSNIRDRARNAVLRHLARAFPRYVPGVSTGGAAKGWAGFLADVKNGWGPPDDNSWDPEKCLTPATALTFWLGGMPDWISGAEKPIRGFRGFSANPLNPFDNSESRIKPFYEFDPNCVHYHTGGGTSGNGLWVGPSNATDTSGAAHSPLVYFRASNNAYWLEGFTSEPKHWQSPEGRVCPAIDTRLSKLDTSISNSTLTWVNPTSFQIFSSGLDMTYGTLSNGPLTDGQKILMFPSGENYGEGTRDDITNFSGGRQLDEVRP